MPHRKSASTLLRTLLVHTTLHSTWPIHLHIHIHIHITQHTGISQHTRITPPRAVHNTYICMHACMHACMCMYRTLLGHTTLHPVRPQLKHTLLGHTAVTLQTKLRHPVPLAPARGLGAGAVVRRKARRQRLSPGAAAGACWRCLHCVLTVLRGYRRACMRGGGSALGVAGASGLCAREDDRDGGSRVAREAITPRCPLSDALSFCSHPTLLPPSFLP